MAIDSVGHIQEWIELLVDDGGVVSSLGGKKDVALPPYESLSSERERLLATRCLPSVVYHHGVIAIIIVIHNMVRKS